jgi:glycosyltransferase involved in cell wall biosynthesis
MARLGETIFGVPCRVGDLGTTGTYCFISATTQQAAEQHGRWRFPNATIGYCGINVDDFPVGGQPTKSGWTGRLLHVGRIDDRKGIDTAIRALSLLDPSVTLDVVGRGDERHLDELRALTRDQGVEQRVRFRVAERHELAAIYAAADAFLFPPRWAEPFGLVPLEAMACSTPVIATGTGGSAEFLLDGANCLLIPVDDPEAMARAVVRLSEDPDLRARLVAGGLATAGELTLPRWLALLEDWHQAAADRFATGAPPHREAIGTVLERALRD